MEYTETLPVENLQSHFTFPLKPAYGEVQRVGELNLRLRVLNDYEFTPVLSAGYPLEIKRSEKNEFIGEFHASDIELTEDFSFDYSLNINENAVSLVAYRAPEIVSAYDLRNPRFSRKKGGWLLSGASRFCSKQRGETRAETNCFNARHIAFDVRR
jgi:hypothetical protein